MPTDLKNAPDEDILLTEEGKQELMNQYALIVTQIAKDLNLNDHDVAISDIAMQMALSESAKDIRIMSIRRNPKEGISPAKIAGIIAFRLIRFSPIHLCGDALNNKWALRLNVMSTMALTLRYILHVRLSDAIPKHASAEIQYSMLYRHMNQETIGAIFEVMKDLEDKSLAIEQNAALKCLN